MATFTASSFASGFIPTGGAAAIYTVPAATKAYIKALSLYNTNAATQTVILYVNPTGTDREWQRVELAVNEFAEALENGATLELQTGGILKGTTTTGSAVTFVISGVLET